MSIGQMSSEAIDVRNLNADQLRQLWQTPGQARIAAKRQAATKYAMEVRRLYETGLSILKLSKVFGVTHQRIHQILHTVDTPMRPARRPRKQRAAQ